MSEITHVATRHRPRPCDTLRVDDAFNRRSNMSRKHIASARRTRASAGKKPLRATVAARPTPLIQLSAHWTFKAHPRYLEAAGFHWPM